MTTVRSTLILAGSFMAALGMVAQSLSPDMAVKPDKSANSTVAQRRSSRVVPPEDSLAGVGVEANAGVKPAPHSWQNLLFGVLIAPHLGQGVSSLAPHSPQNLAASMFW